jgi:hypothetical protein
MGKNLAGTNLPPGNGGVTFPSPTEWPVTYHAITNITRGPQPTVTAPNHGITQGSGINPTKVDFTQVKGMTQINSQSAFVQTVIDQNNFTIALDTSSFSAYTSGGFVNVVQGNAPEDPFENLYGSPYNAG